MGQMTNTRQYLQTRAELSHERLSIPRDADEIRRILGKDLIDAARTSWRVQAKDVSPYAR